MVWNSVAASEGARPKRECRHLTQAPPWEDAPSEKGAEDTALAASRNGMNNEHAIRGGGSFRPAEVGERRVHARCTHFAHTLPSTPRWRASAEHRSSARSQKQPHLVLTILLCDWSSGREAKSVYLNLNGNTRNDPENYNSERYDSAKGRAVLQGIVKNSPLAAPWRPDLGAGRSAMSRETSALLPPTILGQRSRQISARKHDGASARPGAAYSSRPFTYFSSFPFLLAARFL